MLHPGTKKLLGILLLIAAVILFARYILGAALPFLLAGLLALAAEPLVRFFTNRAKFPRWLSSGLGVGIALCLVILGVVTLSAFLIRELGLLAGIVPDLEGTALEGMNALKSWLLQLSDGIPGSLHSLVHNGVEGFFSDSTALLDQLSARLLSLATGVVTRLPGSVLGLGTFIIASFMLSARLPRLKNWIRQRLPERWRSTYLPALGRLRATVLGWLAAQCKLTGVTALVLTAGFLLLRIPYAPLWGLAVALFDALPILGSGMILLPWSLLCFIREETVLGLGLLGLYAAAVIVHSILEPRFLGKHLGLDPLITLVALYAGYRLWGIGGMILAPVLAVTVLQLLNLSGSDPQTQ